MTHATVQTLQEVVSNRLPPVDGLFCGIIGDRPSQSAKSPSIWNHLFRTLDLPVTYLAFDLEARNIAAAVRALRDCEQYLGGNVTVPYKIAVMEHLDDLDDTARAIGAVNTIVRTADGRLIGYNTDGQGALDSVTRAQPGQRDPFMPELKGRRVLMVGAGGAARAVAFAFAGALGREGRLAIVNRTADQASALAAAVNARYGNCTASDGARLEGCDLLINASTVGQFGVRRTSSGLATCLEPYTPLAPCEPPTAAPVKDERTFYRNWIAQARQGIAANQTSGLAAFASASPELAVFEVIFAPVETVLLRHARLSGHRTLNGKGMNIAQAADAFLNRVCTRLLTDRGMTRPDIYNRIVESIYAAW